MQKLKDTQPLCCLTDGVHLHRLQCPTPSHEARVLKALEEKGIIEEYTTVIDPGKISKELGFDAGKMSFDDTILSYAASFSKLADE